MARSERLLAQKMVPTDTGYGRPLEKLLQTNDMLSGMEAQRLRTYFTSNCMEPGRDLDPFGRKVLMGEIEELQSLYEARLALAPLLDEDEAAARASASKDIYVKIWGPTRVPVYNLILLSALINPSTRARHLAIARWLVDEVKVPVDAPDLSGSTALHHAISTKPSFEPEYAQILYDGGADVNHRNRYGATPAHELLMIWNPRDKDAVRKAGDALKWYLDHGGNLDIKDANGITARSMVDQTRKLAKSGLRLPTWKIVDDEDARRKRLAGQICAFCGRPPRGNVALLACSACKSARYCSPGNCQRGDWPHHKTTCKKVPA
ncbi:hypothetical protein GY45DRAFT_1372516 [Cubamyces sp. BRFM 1775]|nr:hypothetical protein GY45DRAFT_1372516 [Cubamyces sp. BRFM 1775]